MKIHANHFECQSRAVSARVRSARSAFSLIELMISIALVLFLILGVNQVFQYTTQAVGAGEAINSAIRASRAAQSAFAADFAAMVPPGTGPNDSACMIINMQAAYAYANAKDQASEGQPMEGVPFIGDNGYNPPLNSPFQDINGDGKVGDPNVPGEITYPYQYNSRNHRIDVMSFFARDLYHRQTGNPGVFVDNLSASEAWIWYGHLWLPDNTGTYPADTTSTTGAFPPTYPAMGNSGTNPNNFYGNQLVLGRMAILMAAKDSNGNITDQSGNKQWYLNKTPGTAQSIGPLDGALPVLETGGGSDQPVPASGQAQYIYQSRVDLAWTSISDFRKTFSTANNGYWYQRMMPGDGYRAPLGGRFQCNPFVSKPMRSADMAQASPYFLGNCSQFIVEFAGDYLTQDNNPGDVAGQGNPVSPSSYGAVTDAGPDGQVDYILVTDPSTGIRRKQILWYGLPRVTSGSSTPNMQLGDVVPVSYWYGLTKSLTGTPVGGAGLPTNDPKWAYVNFEARLPSYGGSVNAASGVYPWTYMHSNSHYTCAWTYLNLKPKLIRITLTIDDPTGRLPNGQTYQYVFAVP